MQRSTGKNDYKTLKEMRCIKGHKQESGSLKKGIIMVKPGIESDSKVRLRTVPYGKRRRRD